MENKRGEVISDGYLLYDLIEGQYYRCRSCQNKTSARAVEECIHYFRCEGKESTEVDGTDGSTGL